MNLTTHLPIFIILGQLITAIVLPLIHRWKEKLTSITVIMAGIINFIMSTIVLFQILKEGPRTYYLGDWHNYLGIEIIYDYITGIVLLLISVILLLVIWYAIGQLKQEIDQGRIGLFFSLLLLLSSSMAGMVMAFDIFNFYVFMEVALITSVAIIGIRDTADSIDGAFKYLIINAIGSSCILLGIAMLYQTTGYLNFGLISQEIAQALNDYPQVLTVATGLFVVGFGIKIALFPLHVWLPDAYSEAPIPAVAILAGLVTKIYCVALIRVVYVILYPEISNIVPLGFVFRLLAALSILFGSFFAITQEDIKRMLAYSSVSQIGYIVLGFSLFTVSGLKGALLHVINYAFMKITLFLAVGNIIKNTGKRDIRNLKGIGKKMPVTLISFSIAALSMIGIPPLNGFFSKWYLAIGSLESGQLILLLVIIISSLLNTFYYLPIIVKAFFDSPTSDLDEVTEVEPRFYFPVLVLGLGCILLGLGVQGPMTIINKAVSSLLIK